jgi:hypothetical protein
MIFSLEVADVLEGPELLATPSLMANRHSSLGTTKFRAGA